MPTDRTVSYKNHLLIAMPQMADPNFSQTITLICDHNSEGAMGIIVNRPLTITQQDLFAHLEINDITDECIDKPVYSGGPVQAERGFVLHTKEQANSDPKWKNTMALADDIYLTTSRDILEDLAHEKGPEDHIIALGYAGWDAQQLEEEISANAWLTVPASIDVIFKTPAEERWQKATQALGFDISQLSTETGHA